MQSALDMVTSACIELTRDPSVESNACDLYTGDHMRCPDVEHNETAAVGALRAGLRECSKAGMQSWERNLRQQPRRVRCR